MILQYSLCCVITIQKMFEHNYAPCTIQLWKIINNIFYKLWNQYTSLMIKQRFHKQKDTWCCYKKCLNMWDYCIRSFCMMKYLSSVCLSIIWSLNVSVFSRNKVFELLFHTAFSLEWFLNICSSTICFIHMLE
jgi:hypothetical protein